MLLSAPTDSQARPVAPPSARGDTAGATIHRISTYPDGSTAGGERRDFRVREDVGNRSAYGAGRIAAALARSRLVPACIARPAVRRPGGFVPGSLRSSGVTYPAISSPVAGLCGGPATRPFPIAGYAFIQGQPERSGGRQTHAERALDTSANNSSPCCALGAILGHFGCYPMPLFP